MPTDSVSPDPFGKYLKARLVKRGAGPRPYESVVADAPLQAGDEDDGDYLTAGDTIYHTDRFATIGEFVFVHEDEVIATASQN